MNLVISFYIQNIAAVMEKRNVWKVCEELLALHLTITAFAY